MTGHAKASSRYSNVAILLHWLIAAALLFEIGLGWRMEGPRTAQSFAVFQLHKSVGITILFLTIIRLASRLASPPPAYPATLKRWERALAQITHVGFYVLLLGLPLTGWLVVSASRTAIPTLLYGLIPWPHVPGVAGLGGAARSGIHEASEFSHHALVYGAYALLALHIAGALKHHFFDRADDLARMLPGPRQRLGLMLGLTVLAMAGALALGNRLMLSAAPAAPVVRPAPAPTAAAPEAPPMAAPAPAAEETKPAAEPAKWRVRDKDSSLGFTSSWSGAAINGRFARWDADIRFDPEALDRSSVKVTIDMASATTGVTDTENALPGDDWFAAAAFPNSTFTANRFRKLSGKRYEARGMLKMRGVSHPVTLPFTLDVRGNEASMSGSVRIDRTIFGVGQGQWAGTEAVPAEVTVTVKLTARRDPATD